MGMKLKTSEAVKLMSKRTGKSMSQMCKELDMGTPGNLILMVNRGSLRARVLAAMCEVCGYKMVLVPEGVDIEDGIEIKGEVDLE